MNKQLKTLEEEPLSIWSTLITHLKEEPFKHMINFNKQHPLQIAPMKKLSQRGSIQVTCNPVRYNEKTVNQHPFRCCPPIDPRKTVSTKEPKKKGYTPKKRSKDSTISPLVGIWTQPSKPFKGERRKEV